MHYLILWCKNKDYEDENKEKTCHNQISNWNLTSWWEGWESFLMISCQVLVITESPFAILMQKCCQMFFFRHSNLIESMLFQECNCKTSNWAYFYFRWFSFWLLWGSRFQKPIPNKAQHKESKLEIKALSNNWCPLFIYLYLLTYVFVYLVLISTV